MPINETSKKLEKFGIKSDIYELDHWSEFIGPVRQQKKNQRKIAIIFLPISFNRCFGFSKEPSQLDGSFEYP